MLTLIVNLGRWKQLIISILLSNLAFASEAGLTWSLIYPSRDRATIRDIANNGSVVVAVGDGGTTRCLLDGSAWAHTESGVTNDLNAVAWSGACFVAVGDAGSIIRSPDGTNWEMQSSSTSENLLDIEWADGLFVAVGANATIRTSPDGITWSARSSGGTTGWFTGVCRAAGTWVAVGWGVTSLTTPVAVSSDGLTWTRPATGLTSNLDGVVYHNGMFLAYNNATVLQSSGGTAWTPLTTSAPKLGSLTVFAGKLTAATPGAIQSSDDGATWQILASGISPSPTCIHGTDNLCWVGSLGGSIGYSPDAVQWTVPPAGHPGSIADITWWNGNWYAVGSMIAISPDADGWRFATKPNGYALRTISASSTALVAAGDGGTILRSTDGSNWSVRRSGFAQPILDVVWTGTRWVAIGSYPFILVSDDDGVTWDEPSTQPAQAFTAIASGGGITVAVSSSNGAGIVSTDGHTWQQVQISDQGLNDVAFDGQRFVAVGSYGAIRASADGFEWSSPASPSATDWNTVGAAPGGGFVAAGSYVTAYSEDGLSWTMASSGMIAPWTNAAASPAGWLMTDSSTPAEHAFSEDGLHWRPVWSNTCPVRDTVAASGEVIIGASSEPTGGNAIIYRGTSPTQWTAQILGTDVGPIQATHWTGQEFLVTGRIGRIWRSPDGLEWDSSVIDEDLRLKRSASRNGRIIAVGDQGAIAYSDDFSTWFEPASGTNDTLNAIAGGAPGWVAGGDHGVLLFSSDGETWSPCADGPSETVEDIIWANGSFHAVGSFSGTYSSTDGVHWTPHSVSDGPVQITSLAWSGTRFVGGGNENVVITSTDGITWETRRIPHYAVESITWTGSSFMAVHPAGVVVSENDSETWAGGPNPWQTTTQGINGGIARFLGGTAEELQDRMPRLVEQSGKRVLEFTRAADSPDHTVIAVEHSLDLIHWGTQSYRTGDGRWFGNSPVNETPASDGSVLVSIPVPEAPAEPCGFQRLRAWNTEPSD